MIAPKLVSDLVEIVESPKAILGKPVWKVSGQKAELVSALVSSSSIDVTLRIRVNPDDINNSVAAMLEVQWQGKRCNIVRFDWRGSEHGNFDIICGSNLRRSAGNTHIHDPSLMQSVTITDFFGKYRKLPVAIPVDPEPSSFTEFLCLSGDLLHIDDMKGLPEPPWSTPLLNL